MARHPGASAIVPMLDDGRIVLIKQYRHAVGGYIYEVPAGKLDNNEAPEDCAKRELIEEIGYRAGQLEKLISIHTTPGFCNEMIHIYLATELQKDQVNHEPNEVIEIEYFTKIEIKEMINSGKITDAKTLVGLLYALQN